MLAAVESCRPAPQLQVPAVAGPRNQHKKQPPASRRLQHFTQIPHDPHQAVSRRNHNPIDKAPHRVPRGFAQLVILVRQRRRQLQRLPAIDLGHRRMQRREHGLRLRRRECGAQLRAPLFNLPQFLFSCFIAEALQQQLQDFF